MGSRDPLADAYERTLSDRRADQLESRLSQVERRMAEIERMVADATGTFDRASLRGHPRADGGGLYGHQRPDA
jgi:hypothetical protein